MTDKLDWPESVTELRKMLTPDARPLFPLPDFAQTSPNLYSIANLASIIEPLLDVLAPRHICEIGAEFGHNTKFLAQYCKAHRAKLSVVDPTIEETPPWLEEIDTSVNRVKSDTYLAGERDADIYFIDGDHNFETVSHELQAIASPGARREPMCIFLHDVGWPFARRDLYYNPDRLARPHPHSFERSLSPFDPDARETGLDGSTEYAIADHEGGEGNGVLTAVEEFITSRDDTWRFSRLPILFGLGILWRETALTGEQKNRLNDFAEWVDRHSPLFATLEFNRLMLLMKLQEGGRIWRDQKRRINKLETGVKMARVDAASHIERFSELEARLLRQLDERTRLKERIGLLEGEKAEQHRKEKEQSARLNQKAGEVAGLHRKVDHLGAENELFRDRLGKLQGRIREKREAWEKNQIYIHHLSSRLEHRQAELAKLKSAGPSSPRRKSCGTGTPLPYSDFGYEVLGPIFYSFCHDLRVHQLAYEDRRPVALHMARAGLRLRWLFELFLEKNGLEPPCPQLDFYTSRLAACRGCLTGDFDFVAPLIIKEFEWQSAGSMFESILPAEVYRDVYSLGLQDCHPGTLAERASVDGFRAVYRSGHPAGKAIRKHFEEQAALMEEYIDRLMGEARYGLFVDSGWAGSTQQLLMRRFPKMNWMGFYCCRYNYGKPPPPHFGRMAGILLEEPAYNRKVPISALLLHRHLLEAPLEPLLPSVSGYVRNDRGIVEADTGIASEVVIAGRSDEPLFQGIAQYFHDQHPAAGPSRLRKNREKAAKALNRKVLHPHPEDIEQMWIEARSADFGKPLQVPVIDTTEPGWGLRAKYHRYRKSLWPQGQLTFDWPLLHPLLNRIHNNRRLRMSILNSAKRPLLRAIAIRDSLLRRS